MDREILYRGKRIHADFYGKSGEWVYGIPIENKIGMFIGFEKNPHYCGQYGYMEIEEISRVAPETVGQACVLIDKNGECIFKDDIVRFDDGQTKFKGTVTNECGAWGIATQDMIPLELKYSCKNDNFISFWELMWNSDDPDCLIDGYVPYVEVIGNIHDNSELLEVSE